jgi:hypothetical protein
VQSLPTPCPGCESLQPFRPQYRPHDDSTVEVFIRCAVCNWELVLRRSTPDIERLYRMRARWEAYGRATRVKHGVTSSLAMVQLKRINAKIRELEDEIA